MLEKCQVQQFSSTKHSVVYSVCTGVIPGGSKGFLHGQKVDSASPLMVSEPLNRGDDLYPSNGEVNPTFFGHRKPTFPDFGQLSQGWTLLCKKVHPPLMTMVHQSGNKSKLLNPPIKMNRNKWKIESNIFFFLQQWKNQWMIAKLNGHWPPLPPKTKRIKFSIIHLYFDVVPKL